MLSFFLLKPILTGLLFGLDTRISDGEPAKWWSHRQVAYHPRSYWPSVTSKLTDLFDLMCLYFEASVNKTSLFHINVNKLYIRLIYFLCYLTKTSINYFQVIEQNFIQYSNCRTVLSTSHNIYDLRKIKHGVYIAPIISSYSWTRPSNH